MSIRPIHDRIVVRQSAKQEVSKGGIVLAGGAAEAPDEGIIVAVGSGKPYDSGITLPLQVSVGDKILYGKYSGTEITVNNEKLLIMKEADILCVIE
ncbi:MAG: co-chaperone GroES [Methylotenera sp.]|nr:MAG: co-chaperone GroES [Methylotenera sp.]